jgi:serine/threonine protein kinase
VIQAERLATTDATLTALPTEGVDRREQIQGHDVDQRSDLFAFGIILYEMLTWRYPWPRPSPAETLHAILHDDPEAYNDFMAGLRESYADRPETIGSAIQRLSKAVARDPEWAPAHAWLSVVAMNMHFEFDPRRTLLEKAEHHCCRALMLDPALPEAHLAQAWILWSPAKGFQHLEAIAAREQVLAVQPNLERAHNRMWNAASTPVSRAGPFSESTHISNACRRRPNSNSSLPTSSTSTNLSCKTARSARPSRSK